MNDAQREEAEALRSVYETTLADAQAPVWTEGYPEGADPYQDRYDVPGEGATAFLMTAGDEQPLPTTDEQPLPEREPWEPYFSERELAIVERVLLVYSLGLLYSETHDTIFVQLGTESASKLYAYAGGRAALIEALVELGPRVGDLVSRMAAGTTKGVFEPPF